MVFLTSVPSQSKRADKRFCIRSTDRDPRLGARGTLLLEGSFPPANKGRALLAAYPVAKSLSGQDPCAEAGSHLLTSPFPLATL